MIKNIKVYKPSMLYCQKVIPLAFDESMSYYECICNIGNKINNDIIPKVNESNELVEKNTEVVIELNDNFIELQEYVYENIKTKLSQFENDTDFITKDVDDLTYYTKSSDLSSVATSGDYDDLTNKPTIPDVSDFITKDVDDLTNYYDKTSINGIQTSIVNLIPTKTSDLQNDSDFITFSDIPTNLSSYVNDEGFITKDVNDLTNYTTSSALTTLLSNKEDISVLGSNANGNYLKLANGVLIQWNKIEVSDQAINGAYGTLYQGSRTITFPIAFVGDLPTVQCSEFQYGTGGSWGCVVGNGTTLTGTTLRVWDCYSRDAGTNCRISWIAIGKWK